MKSSIVGTIVTYLTSALGILVLPNSLFNPVYFLFCFAVITITAMVIGHIASDIFKNFKNNNK